MASRIHLARQGLITKNKPALSFTEFTNTSSVAALLLHVNSSNLIRDASINNWTTTVTGATTSTVQSRNSEVSIFFDGSNDNVVFTTANQAATSIGTRDYTLESWIWPDSTLASGTIMGSLTFGGTTNWWFSFTATNPLGLTFFNGASGWNPSVGSAITGNAWNHIAVTRQGTTQRFWINGVQAAEQSNSTNLGNTINISAGADSNGEATTFKGYVNRTRLVVGAALYQTNFTPPTTLTTSSLQIISGGTTSTYGSYLLA